MVLIYFIFLVASQLILYDLLYGFDAIFALSNRPHQCLVHNYACVFVGLLQGLLNFARRPLLPMFVADIFCLSFSCEGSASTFLLFS